MSDFEIQAVEEKRGEFVFVLLLEDNLKILVEDVIEEIRND